MRTPKPLRKYFLALTLGVFLLSSCGGDKTSSSLDPSGSDTTSETASSDSASNTSSDSISSSSSNSSPYTGTYYNAINDSSGSATLLSGLRSLNSTKRTKTVGYGSMGTYYKQTDGDPTNSNNLISFYSGTSASFDGSFANGKNFNREHVWPNSRGGSAVENDIHVIRPTKQSENSSRGNSFYVEGMTSSSGGWDPGAVSFGLDKYRGISARIIFYCVVASSTLSLVDLTNDSTGNKTMGKLSDLLEWNLEYDIDATELRRNEAAQTIQGNRNPFIDHPEYACKLWGSTNSSTKSICGMS